MLVERPEERWGLGCEPRPGAGQKTTPEPRANEIEPAGCARERAQERSPPWGENVGGTAVASVPCGRGSFTFVVPATGRAEGTIMEQVTVTMVDGSARQYPTGTTLAAIAQDVRRRDALAARVNGKLTDLRTLMESDATVEWVTFDDPAGREVYWHSTAHLLAQAVRELFPQAKLAIGPPIEDGFYYDFDIGRPFTPEDL
ncbi:MAG TPA: TGS domain-containing protein, partial [bacterium]|nr:TGS domain-containing protein [bacterium]